MRRLSQVVFVAKTLRIRESLNLFGPRIGTRNSGTVTYGDDNKAARRIADQHLCHCNLFPHGISIEGVCQLRYGRGRLEFIIVSISLLLLRGTLCTQ